MAGALKPQIFPNGTPARALKTTKHTVPAATAYVAVCKAAMILVYIHCQNS